MIPYFPKLIANKGLTLYAVSLLIVSVAFMSHAISFTWMLMGLAEVALFFLLSNKLTKEWQRISVNHFVKNLFWTAIVLRVAWVIFSYFFYTKQTGQPFEFGAADSISYHETAEWLSDCDWKFIMNYCLWNRNGVSDSGYDLYLTTFYKIFGVNIIGVRIVKAFYSSLTCVLLYKLAARVIGEQPGRMAGVFAMLMPNLIIYCGLHVKETEMLFLTVAFLERADYACRASKITFGNVLVTLLLAGSLFFFRTVLGAVALFSFVSALVFSPTRKVKKGRKAMLMVWVILAVVLAMGGTIVNEVEGYWNDRGTNQDLKRMAQTSKGNQWAKYATGTVMAPMMMVMPFSTMVDTDQNNQLVVGGGNYVRNFMGIFVLITLFSALFVKKNWREFALVGSYTVGYLGIISLSGFANSERFLLPGVIGLIIMWAYGVSILNAKSMKFVKAWYVIVVLMEVGWAYFKIGSRGMLG